METAFCYALIKGGLVSVLSFIRCLLLVAVIFSRFIFTVISLSLRTISLPTLSFSLYQRSPSWWPSRSSGGLTKSNTVTSAVQDRPETAFIGMLVWSEVWMMETPQVWRDHSSIKFSEMFLQYGKTLGKILHEGRCVNCQNEVCLQRKYLHKEIETLTNENERELILEALSG